MGDEENGFPREAPPQVACALVLANSLTHYEATADGGMTLCFSPVQPVPGGLAVATPQVRVRFSAEGWERFRREVAADGRRSPIVRAFPFVPPPSGS